MKLIYKALFLLAFITISGCTSWTRIGSVTTVGTRNIESSIDYVELKRYVEATSLGDVWHTDNFGVKTKVEFTDRITSETFGNLNLAIDYAVRSVPGGEYLKNVQIFYLNGQVKVLGDVWGIQPPSNENDGEIGIFRIGDSVTWRIGNKTQSGIIKEINGDKITVQTDSGNLVVKSKSALSK